MLSAVGQEVPQYPASDDLRPGLYIGLFHGRTDPDEDLNGWGTNGPIIGPLKYVHSTYCSDIKFEFERLVDHHLYFPASSNRPNGDGQWAHGPDAHLKYVEDLVEYGGMYYGDWTVFYAQGKSNSMFGRRAG